MQAVLRGFTQGRLFRLVFPWVLRLVALLLLVFGVYVWIEVWIHISRPVGIILATIFSQLLWIVALYALIHTLLIRASDIARLPEGDYPAVSTACILFRLIGELGAVISLFIGIVGCVAIWIAGADGTSLIAGLPLVPDIPILTASGFLVGLQLLLMSIVQATLYVLGAYLVAELVMVTVAIFRNTRTIRESMEK